MLPFASVRTVVAVQRRLSSGLEPHTLRFDSARVRPRVRPRQSGPTCTRKDYGISLKLKLLFAAVVGIRLRQVINSSAVAAAAGPLSECFRVSSLCGRMVPRFAAREQPKGGGEFPDVSTK